jgi:hypothetical protein
MKYKANWREGVRPCIKDDILDVKFEVITDQSDYIHTSKKRFSADYDRDPRKIIPINYKVFKSKLLTTLFDVVE